MLDDRREMRLTIEIDTRAQPIAGWLQPAGGQQLTFVGMLELCSLIEALREQAPPGAESPRTP